MFRAAIKLFVCGLAGLATAGCKEPAIQQPRADIIGAAIEHTKQSVQVPSLQVDKFNLHRSVRLDLTAADSANRVTEKWCLRIKYIRRTSTTPWVDSRTDVLVTVTENEVTYRDNVLVCQDLLSK